MSGNNAAGVPPTGGSNALATGAAAGVAGLAAASDAGATGGEDESSGEESAPKPVAPPRMRIAASPGMDEGTDVRIKLANNMYGKGVVSGERNFDGTYPVAGLMDNGQQTPASNLFHHQQVYTVAEYERDYASRRGQLPGNAPMMPQMATRDAPAARAPARYASETVPPGFGYSKGGIVSRVFGSAARLVDKCWPPFLLLAQSVARDYLDQDVLTLVEAVEQALEGAEGEGVDVAPPAFDVFDDAESVLRGHVLRLGTALKEVAGRKAKKQRIEDPSSRQPGSLGLRIMEELLGGTLAPGAKVLCDGLEDAGRTMTTAREVLGKPPEGDLARALQRVARSTGPGRLRTGDAV